MLLLDTMTTLLYLCDDTVTAAVDIRKKLPPSYVMKVNKIDGTSENL